MRVVLRGRWFGGEVNKGNVQMLYKPNGFMSITTGHESILEPQIVVRTVPPAKAAPNPASAPTPQ